MEAPCYSRRGCTITQRHCHRPFQGVNTLHIMKTRGLDTSICLSDLLVSESPPHMHAA
jgi:hypothetical protein